MKKIGFLSIALLIASPGCSNRKKTTIEMNDRDYDAIAATPHNYSEDRRLYRESDKPSEYIREDDDLASSDENDKQEFAPIRFAFHSYTIGKDQADNLSYDIQRAQEILEKNPHTMFVIEGHACHSAGGREYNLSLSERRAKTVADRFKSAGIPKKSIKIVGRGAEFPVIIEGKPVTGNRAQQAPNRRVEIHAIND